MERVKVLQVFADGWSEYNSSRFRVSNLCDHNPYIDYRLLYASSWMSTKTSMLEDWADVIIIQRVAIETSLLKMQHWIGQGKKIVIDFDDAYNLIRDDNAAFDFWSKGQVAVREGGIEQKKNLQKHPVDQMKIALSIAGHFTTPSKQLCADWSLYAEPHWLPN